MGRKRKNTTSTTTLSPKSAKVTPAASASMTHLSDSEPKKRNPLREVCTYLDYERNGWPVD